MQARLYETHLPVADVDQSVAFYEEIVGLKLAERLESRNCTFLWFGDKQSGMLGLWGPGNKIGRHEGVIAPGHFAMQVPLETLHTLPAELAQKGITCRGFHGETEGLPSVIGWMPSAQIYFPDPDDHSIEFISVLEDPPIPLFIGTWSQWQERRAATASADA